MNDKKEKIESESFKNYDEEEAYQTLVNWVKSVPNAIKEIDKTVQRKNLFDIKRR